MKTKKLTSEGGVVQRTLTLSPLEAAHVIAQYAKFHSYFNVCKLAKSFQDVPTNGCWVASGEDCQVLVSSE